MPDPSLDSLIDPLPLAQALMRCNSVTPADGGSLSVLSHALERLGFTVTRLKYGEIDNIFARRALCRELHGCEHGHDDV